MKKAFTLKNMMMLMMAFTLLIAMIAPSTADARRGGGFKSGPRSYQSTPSKANDSSSGINKSDSGTKSSAATANTSRTGGFLGGGGGFLKGMMLGGLAGMLFGGLFGNMGALGSLLGLAVNVLAIYVLIMVGVGIYRAIKNRRRPDDSRGGRY
ncbi:hypothetical protein B4V02_11105 [Paenibacillus kribbensis]|uniref:Preprotein translocase subunit Tim44 n=1 Tax=Paenibacillus kribbensis TaxID=172713 RepID=A0A222WM59_9BACL|nr:hypothetical protein [Paenibacillus kribbensis]ASR47196.1 hypothetical protein B4V02_11105 [Paenibacillus kribbensis]